MNEIADSDVSSAPSILAELDGTRNPHVVRRMWLTMGFILIPFASTCC